MRRTLYSPSVSRLLSGVLLAAAVASPLAAAPRTDDFTLDLGGQRFDPRAQDPAQLLPAAWRGEAGARAPEAADLQLLQLAGPSQRGTVEALRAAGLEPVQYVHPFTYIVWGSPAALGRAAATAPVAARWNGPFEPAYKVQPHWRALGPARIEIDALIYRGADVEAAVQRLYSLGAEVKGRKDLDRRFHHVVLHLAGDRLLDAARIPGVYTLQPQPTDGGLRGEMADSLSAGNVDGSGIALPGYLAWLNSVGLSGAGVVIANVDSGVQQNHADLTGRMLACTGTTCGGATSSSHGTHTAGIMAGDGASGTLDSRGLLRGLGAAPGASLVEQLYTPTFTQAGGMRTLMEDSYTNGARISGNSWGPAGSPAGYDNDTLQVDLSVRDADDDLPGNQPLTYVLSIMNGNGGVSSQGTPDEAKNTFTVGSTRLQASNGSQETQFNDISANSGHGPALDGRKIPHIVAPGCRIDSTDTGGGGYGLKCGTSMASPHVSGAVALFFEQYRKQFSADPSPAMVKAAFLPIAKDLAGFRDADGVVLGHRFDSKQGWGRFDLAALVAPQQPVLYYDNPQIFEATGDSWQLSLRRAVAGQPVKMMLVWTDAAGHGLGGSTPAWNNDLDLEVTEGAATYLGNVFGADGWSTTGGTSDDRNNTEGVLLPAAPVGDFTVTVTATNLASDGIPGEGAATDQDFAFVCYNCELSPEAQPLFADGFESGDVLGWSFTQP